MSTDTDLRTQLRELAGEAPHGGLVAGELWRTGLRRQRLRRGAAVAVTAVVIALVVGTGVLLGPPSRPDPAPADVAFEDLAIPRTVHAPDAWSAGTDELGPPGPLAAVGVTRRLGASGLRGTRGWYQLFGVSAVDGSARFLDLRTFRDGYDAPAFPALSPDGRKVAVPRFRTGLDASRRDLAGWDVYDTVTGELTELRVPGLGSITGTDVFEPRFSGDSRYLVTNFSLAGTDGARADSLVAWDVRSAEYDVAEGTGHYWLPNPGSGPHGIVWGRGLRTLTHDPDTGRTSEQPVPQEVIEPWYADDGETLAYLGRPPTARNQPAGRWRLYVAGRGSDAPREIEAGIEPEKILGWRDATHLVVSAGGPSRARVVDLERGEAEPLPMSAGDSRAMPPLYAADLFANPLVDGEAQPGAQDPRVWLRWWFWVGGAGLLAGFAGLLWRRRARG